MISSHCKFVHPHDGGGRHRSLVVDQKSTGDEGNHHPLLGIIGMCSGCLNIECHGTRLDRRHWLCDPRDGARRLNVGRSKELAMKKLILAAGFSLLAATATFAQDTTTIQPAQDGTATTGGQGTGSGTDGTLPLPDNSSSNSNDNSSSSAGSADGGANGNTSGDAGSSSSGNSSSGNGSGGSDGGSSSGGSSGGSGGSSGGGSDGGSGGGS
jgi:hypothetical protein